MPQLPLAGLSAALKKIYTATDEPTAQVALDEFDPTIGQVGVHYILVALNKCDMVDDEEIIELGEMEIRELLAEQDYDEDVSVADLVRAQDGARLHNADCSCGNVVLLRIHHARVLRVSLRAASRLALRSSVARPLSTGA